MSRRRTLGTKKKIALLVSAATVAGGGAFVMASTSNASQTPTVKSAADSTVCQGLATALGNNQKFIDGQKANPDAQSAARIANREAVIAFFNQNEDWLAGVLEQGGAVGSLHLDGAPSEVAQAIIGGLEGAMLVARPYGDVARFQTSVGRLLSTLAGRGSK